ncbi:MAG: hypothetical protein ABSC71_19330 [Candidatus Acidiferrales bacterium]|jgi:hypothetical protein
MKRSAGITITAVIDFVGSAFTLFTAPMSVFVLAVQSIIPPSRPGAAPIEIPSMLHYMQIAAVLIFVLAAAWGIATGVGLLKLREWSRISQLLFAGLIALIGVSSAMLMLAIQLPVPVNDPHPETAAHVLQITRFFIAIFYGGLAALGIWWLYYFTRRPIRDEFRTRSGASVAVVDGLPGGIPRGSTEPFPGPMNRARPVSITIIAALMLLRLLSFVALPFVRVPLLFFGSIIAGPAGTALLMLFGLVQGIAGYGLLKMKMWGRNLAIAVELTNVANVVATGLLPGSQANFDSAMQQIYAQWNLPANVPMIHFPVALMMLPAIPVLLVVLYFLIKEKPAFVEAERKAALKSS